MASPRLRDFNHFTEPRTSLLAELCICPKVVKAEEGCRPLWGSLRVHKNNKDKWLIDKDFSPISQWRWYVIDYCNCRYKSFSNSGIYLQSKPYYYYKGLQLLQVYALCPYHVSSEFHQNPTWCHQHSYKLTVRFGVVRKFKIGFPSLQARPRVFTFPPLFPSNL